MTPAETRAATLAKLREHAGFAEVWGFWRGCRLNMDAASDDRYIEALIVIAYDVGREHGLDRAIEMLGKPREVA